MARYEIGAVYKFADENEKVYYVRLLQDDSYGVFAPFDGEANEETFSQTPYQLYFVCNSFPVKRGIWEKVLSSPDIENVERWKAPDMANYGNYNPVLFLEQHRVWHNGDPYVCDKNKFIATVKAGLIENIFNHHEIIPSFLRNYYDDWPRSYIMEEVHISSGTAEHQKAHRAALQELGFDI
jgi:hypothetical protein